MNGYDRSYREIPGLFGDVPEDMLQRFADRIAAGGRVLDIGCGQGRNTIWLAQQGLRVGGLDPSAVALQTVRRLAADQRVEVETVHGGFADMADPTVPFDGVCIFGLMQILDRGDISRLVATIERWTTRGSMLFLSAWSVADPAYESAQSSRQLVGPGSFELPDGGVRTFLEPGEVTSLFEGWTPIWHCEGLGPWHRHGDGPRERHGRTKRQIGAGPAHPAKRPLCR